MKEEKKKDRLRNSDKGRIEAKDIGAADSGTKKWWQYNALWGMYCRFPKDPKILLPWCASLSLSLCSLANVCFARDIRWCWRMIDCNTVKEYHISIICGLPLAVPLLLTSQQRLIN